MPRSHEVFPKPKGRPKAYEWAELVISTGSAAATLNGLECDRRGRVEVVHGTREGTDYRLLVRLPKKPSGRRAKKNEEAPSA